ncbi:MAG: saccharopine dehydrogenase NADP-binding domain-containing protein [Planctomycetota bacterium]
MHDVLLLGAGKIGATIAQFLADSGDYAVAVADVDAAALGRVQERCPKVSASPLDADDQAALDKLMAGKAAVISALSFKLNPTIAEAALRAGASYFDLTEDVETTRRVRELAADAKDGQVFMPQCGLAPGFVGIVGHHLAQQFDELDTCHMRVGALPTFPTKMLKYNLTWSTDGLINEYCNPCEAIVHGKAVDVQALEGVETFSIDGVSYEAFNTSGGLGTLCQTLEGKARTLDYKTIRYIGHRQLAHFMVNELRMRDDRENLKMILERAVPMTNQDVVIVFVTATGKKDGRYLQISDARKIYNVTVGDQPWSAIQVTTASGMCTAVDLHFAGKLPSRGFVRQEQVGLPEFLHNRFGEYYAMGEHRGVQVDPISVEDAGVTEA